MDSNKIDNKTQTENEAGTEEIKISKPSLNKTKEVNLVLKNEAESENRLVTFLKRIDMRIREYIKSPFGKVTLLGGFLVLLAIPLLILVLGLDSLFIRSSVQGRIFDINKNTIDKATIELQGQTITTDSTGFFEFSNLDHGKWKVIIKANGYNTVEKDIVIERFGNKMDFELIPLDFGVLNGKLIANELKIDKLEFLINDQKLKINEDGSFTTGRLISGEYKLKFTSPFYKDFEREIEIKSGIHSLDDITLEEAADIFGEVLDFVSKSKVITLEVKVKGTDKTIDRKENVFRLNDLTVDSVISLRFEAQNYISFENDYKLLTGENDLGKILLVPEGKIISYKSERLIETNIDGSSERILTGSLTGCIYDTRIQSQIFIRCGDKYYSLNLGSTSLTRLATGLANTDGYIIGVGAIKIVNSAAKGLLKSVSDNGTERVLFEKDDEVVLSYVYNKSDGTVYLSTNAGIYKAKINETNNALKITDGEFLLKDLSLDGTQIISLNETSPGIFNIWSIKLDGTKRKITNNPDKYSSLKYITGSSIIYIKNRNLYILDLPSNTEKQLAQGVDRYIVNSDIGLVTVNVGNEIYVFNFSGSGEKFR